MKCKYNKEGIELFSDWKLMSFKNEKKMQHMFFKNQKTSLVSYVVFVVLDLKWFANHCAVSSFTFYTASVQPFGKGVVQYLSFEWQPLVEISWNILRQSP